MFKKFFLACVFLSVSLVLSACGSSSDLEYSYPVSHEAKRDKSIGSLVGDKAKVVLRSSKEGDNDCECVKDKSPTQNVKSEKCVKCDKQAGGSKKCKCKHSQ
jgi:hypothetical protein